MGRRRRAEIPRLGWHDQPGCHQPDLQSDRPGWRSGRLLPGQPRRPADARAHGVARAHPPRVPRPRGPSRHHGRPRSVQGLALPDAGHALRGSAQARPRRGGSLVPGLQPLARRGLGHGVRRPHLRCPLHLFGRRGRGRPRARVGAGCGCPHRRHAGGGADHGDGAALTGRRRLRPLWARVNEAGITVVVHVGDAGLSSNGYAADGFSASFRAGPARPSIKMFGIERAAHDFLATLILERLFDRFPNLRIASVETARSSSPHCSRRCVRRPGACPATSPRTPC